MRQYIAIDLKSFYASVEARERGLDPLTTNLVVADVSRTEKTICLAVSPSLKSYGISGRARLFEVVQRVRDVNRRRQARLGRAAGSGGNGGPGRNADSGGNAGPDPNEYFTGESYDINELQRNPSLKVSYIAATPRMSLYMEYSTRIYQIYLKYIAPEDIHVYSIDEVFIDATNYLNTYRLTPRELAMKMIREVLQETGITATAGIGTNLYLAKIAMDIMAKKVPPNEEGVRIAELDEMSYRYQLWDHRPLTDFWRVGPGYAKKLEAAGIFTMGDVARCSVRNEELLYRLFGINAELLIDHAWGWEPCTIELVKQYEPEDRSFTSGQVLMSPYSAEKARIVVREMADAAALDLVEKRMVTDQVVLTVGYENLTGQAKGYSGEITIDRYGKKTPKHAHGTENIGSFTSSGKLITDAVLKVYDRTVDPALLIRRIYLVVNHVISEEKVQAPAFEQMDLFTDYTAREREAREREKERKIQEAMIDIKQKFGKNAILKGVNLVDGATAKERNRMVGGHKA